MHRKNYSGKLKEICLRGEEGEVIIENLFGFNTGSGQIRETVYFGKFITVFVSNRCRVLAIDIVKKIKELHNEHDVLLTQ